LLEKSIDSMEKSRRTVGLTDVFGSFLAYKWANQYSTPQQEDSGTFSLRPGKCTRCQRSQQVRGTPWMALQSRTKTVWCQPKDNTNILFLRKGAKFSDMTGKKEIIFIFFIIKQFQYIEPTVRVSHFAVFKTNHWVCNLKLPPYL
jgi:hypothetical protein